MILIINNKNSVLKNTEFFVVQQYFVCYYIIT